ncbi:hypothetical protein ACA910_004975 [Epithemia clementina (nom. ined.)]
MRQNFYAKTFSYCMLVEAGNHSGLSSHSNSSCWIRRAALSLARTTRKIPPSPPPPLSSKAAGVDYCGRPYNTIIEISGKMAITRSFTSTATTNDNCYDGATIELLQNISTALSQKDAAVAPNLSVMSKSSQPSKLHTPSIWLRSVAGRFGRSYRKLHPIALNSPDSCQRTRVLRHIATDMNMDPSRVAVAVQLFEKAASHQSSLDSIPLTAYTRLHESCSPVYEELFRLVIQDHAAEGMQSVLEIREDLVLWIHCLASTNEQQAKLINKLKRLDGFLQNLMSSWMVPGLIQFRRLTYDETSASILERIVKNEAVHPVTSLDDLRKRLGPGRRVFALFHPCLPAVEPLYVLYVALLDNAPSSMDQIHSIDRENYAEKPTVATFYSISSLRSGLSGMGLAEHLIHSAVENIQDTLPTIKTFCTLSPLPTFRTWLTERIHCPDANVFDSLPSPSNACVDAVKEYLGSETPGGSTSGTLAAALDCLANARQSAPNRQSQTTTKQSLSVEGSGLDDDTRDNILEALRPWLMECAAHYLVREKHRRKPLDGVARFHIGNGAVLDRLHWKADLSRTGWIKSWGIMVTYRYDLDSLPENRFNYDSITTSETKNGTAYQIPLGADIQRLLDT